MDVVQMITGRGGWPLNCFALPNGKPLFGGTYFPKETWKYVLQNIHNMYRHDLVKVEMFVKEIEEGIKALSETVSIMKNETITTQTLDEMVKKMSSSFDTVFGGYNYSPKFPMPCNYQFLLHYAYTLEKKGRREEAETLNNFITLTLDKMALGGIYDIVEGGFARYSTDAIWKAPHFEKMLYDNGQLMSLYSAAFSGSPKKQYSEVVYGIHDFVSSNLASPNGGFFSSLDADSEGAEGEYYVWKKEELETLISEDFKLFSSYFSINDADIWENGKYILYRKKNDEIFCKDENIDMELFQQQKNLWLKILKEYRQKRVNPPLDDKIIASWNGMMLKGYLDAYKTFKAKEFLNAAKQNALFLSERMLKKDGSMFHCCKNEKPYIDGFLEDYAFVSDACFSLYEITFDEKWLTHAITITEYAIKHFYDEQMEVFYFTNKDSPVIISKKIEITDGVIPSSTSVMANVLFKLGLATGKQEFSDISDIVLKNIMGKFLEYPQGYANWAILLLNFLHPFYAVVITGSIALPFADKINGLYLPNKIVQGSVNNSEMEMFKGKFHPGKTQIFICEGKTCLPPVSSPAEAIKLLI
jgi:uncharacterized protein YyaL (SSP411 family)